MNTISQQELETLCLNGEAIDNKGGYPAVVLHPDDSITKLWARKKKRFSSTTLRPYSNRFVKNAAELRRRGITVPDILKHARVENSHIRVVTYRSLPGKSIRELLENQPDAVNIPELCQYIEELHQRGILFRGMHLGNIIQRPLGKGYGLIDFTDVKFYAKPLPLRRRAANLATPLRYKEDIDRSKAAGHPCLQDTYISLLKLNGNEAERFKNGIKSYLK